jgi:uncharacterized protein (DUF1015 family)
MQQEASDPSGAQSETVPRAVQPFRAALYDPAVVGDIAAVCSPPYDVVDEEELGQLLDSSPFNSVRLILPRCLLDSESPSSDTQSPAVRARELLRSWLQDGVLAVDDKPCLYSYEMEYVHPLYGHSTTRGVIAAVSLELPGRIFPHEDTLEQPLSDQIALLEATRANLSPIYLLATSPNSDISATAKEAAEPLGRCIEAGNVHKFGRIADPSAIGQICQALEGCEYVIADGHHRFEAARRLHATRPGPGTDRIMALVVALEDATRALRPTHRIVPSDAVDRGHSLSSVSARPAGLASAFEEAFGPLEATLPDPEILDPLLADGHPVAILCRPGTSADHQSTPTVLVGQVQETDSNADPESVEASLPVVVLHRRVLRDYSPEALSYTPSAEEAFAAVAKGSAQAAFLLPQPDIKAVVALARAGIRLPQKSTYFYPKPRTGAVFRLLEQP